MASVAIIVPFRIQKGQNREWELQEFTSYMTKYMNDLLKNDKLKKFHIYVIEQNYGKKFNRGILLNIGFHLTNELYDTFIFHDVDLLPDKNLRNYYCMKPEYQKIYTSQPNDITIMKIVVHNYGRSCGVLILFTNLQIYSVLGKS